MSPFLFNTILKDPGSGIQEGRKGGRKERRKKGKDGEREGEKEREEIKGNKIGKEEINSLVTDNTSYKQKSLRNPPNISRINK